MNPITLPIPTNIPLDVLAANPTVFLDLDQRRKGDRVRTRLKNCMRWQGELMWMILINTKTDVLGWKNCGDECVEMLNALLSEHGLQLGMFPELRRARRLEILPPKSIDELFDYVPAVRPPLTDAQVAFLRRPIEGAFAKSTRQNMWLGYTHCVTVLDLVLLLPNIRSDDDIAQSLRRELEVTLGPLPLQLPVEELGRIKAEKPERSYHV